MAQDSSESPSRRRRTRGVVEETPAPEVTNPEVREALIFHRILRRVSQGACSRDAVFDELGESYGISKKAITQVMDSLAPDPQEDEKVFQATAALGLRRTKEGVELDPATSWFRNSAMYKRIRVAAQGKALIAQLVGDKILELIKEQFIKQQLWIFLGEGSSTLACARYIGRERMHLWNVLTTNLMIALDLISGTSCKCYLPEGSPNLDAAGILEIKRESLERWFRAHQPEVAVTAFHYLRIQPDGALDFCVRTYGEHATKLAALSYPSKALFLIVDKSKIEPHGEVTVRFADGRWFDLHSASDSERAVASPMTLRAERIYFCTDAPEGLHPELEKLKSAGVEILRP